MTIQELIDELNKVKDKTQQAQVSVYWQDDSGEQDHYIVSEVAVYHDGSVQIKT